MAKRIAVRSLAQGVKMTTTAEYKTSDGRKWTNVGQANRWQTNLNRTAEIKNVLRKSGLLAYKSNDNILSVGPLAMNLTNPDFLNRLLAAANGRKPRTRRVVAMA